MFKNREAAAQNLAQILSPHQAEHPLVLGIPRGGVPMAATIAQALGGDLDVVLVHKLGTPFQPELAMGAVHESGTVHVSPLAKQMGVGQAEIDAEVAAQLQVLRERRRRYTPEQSHIDPAGRVVIIVDDGSATGATMLAALEAVKLQKPKKLIAALGVTAPETATKLRAVADEVACLQTPAFFHAVGQFFEDFSPVSDEEVIATLHKFHRATKKSAYGQ